jgi:hypothetical protein
VDCCFSEHYNNTNQRDGLSQSGPHYHLIENYLNNIAEKLLNWHYYITDTVSSVGQCGGKEFDEQCKA